MLTLQRHHILDGKQALAALEAARESDRELTREQAETLMRALGHPLPSQMQPHKNLAGEICFRASALSNYIHQQDALVGRRRDR